MLPLPLNLPNFEKIKLVNEVDRFGFSCFLRDRLKFKYKINSSCIWFNGWLWHGITEMDILENPNIDKSTPIIVSTYQQKKNTLRDGFTNVIIGGLPFGYIHRDMSHRCSIERIKNSVLLIIPKLVGSSPTQAIELIDKAKKFKNSGYSLCVCIFERDLENRELYDTLKKHEIDYVFGASAYDKNALERMFILFSTFEFVLSNVIGSHMVYAALCGCKIGLLETKTPIIHVSRRVLKFSYARDRDINGYLNFWDRKYSWLKVKSPQEAKQHIEWGMDESGYRYHLNDDELLSALGWTFKGVIFGVYRRINQKINLLIKK
jgi:hypothetical protein